MPSSRESGLAESTADEEDTSASERPSSELPHALQAVVNNKLPRMSRGFIREG